MKKKNYVTLIIAVAAMLAGYNIYATQNGKKISDLILANVEALANDESDAGGGDWFCDSYLFDSYTEKRWDYIQKCYESVKYDTYMCTKARFGSCSGGYMKYSYDCKGSQTSSADYRTSEGCE